MPRAHRRLSDTHPRVPRRQGPHACACAPTPTPPTTPKRCRRLRRRGHRPVPHRAHVPGRAHASSSRRFILNAAELIRRAQAACRLVREAPGAATSYEHARGHGRPAGDRAPASTRRCTSSWRARVELAVEDRQDRQGDRRRSDAIADEARPAREDRRLARSRTRCSACAACRLGICLPDPVPRCRCAPCATACARLQKDTASRRSPRS